MSEPWFDRLLGERDELLKRLNNLNMFLARGDASQIVRNSDDYALLVEQQKHMSAYANVIARRLAKATAAKE